ncbi:MAG: SDR family oxidoreductase [Deltaproteobacteria bacterium]|nr:MAG: SDR family oxidoreductase [Deltaproteobacteria bacterium]
MSLVIVTGASRGIGRIVALRLAERGHTVACMSRTAAELDSLHAENPRCLPVVVDVTDLPAVRRLVDELQAEHGPCAILVNNAGYGLRSAVEDIDLDAWRAEFELNLFAATHLAQCVLPAMREARDGVIVQVSSVAGRVAVPLSGAYCATKFALKATSDAMRVEVAPFGIRVVQIEPGPVRTAFAAVAADHSADTLGSEDSPYAPMYREFSANLSKLHSQAWQPETVADRILAAIDKGSARVSAYGLLLKASVQISHFWPTLHDRLVGQRMGVDKLR